jgi:hypothetical protein
MKFNKNLSLLLLFIFFLILTCKKPADYGPQQRKLIKNVIFSYLIVNNIVTILLLLQKSTKFDQETVSLLCVKTKSGVHKQQT